MVASIREVGLLQPIVVREKGKKYEIIAGERRWRACKIAGDKEISCKIVDVDDTTAKIMTASENFHREDLKPIEKEKFLAELYKEGLKNKKWKSKNDMAKETGIPQATLNKIILAHEDRKENSISTKNPYQDLDITRPLKDRPKIRKKLLKIREKGMLTQTVLRELTKILKEAPEPMAKAMIGEIKDSIFKLPPELQHIPEGLAYFPKPPDIKGDLTAEGEKTSLSFVFKNEEEAKIISSMFKLIRLDGKESRSRMLSGDRLFNLLKEVKMIEKA